MRASSCREDAEFCTSDGVTCRKVQRLDNVQLRNEIYIIGYVLKCYIILTYLYKLLSGYCGGL